MFFASDEKGGGGDVNGLVRFAKIGRLYKLVKLTRLLRILKLAKQKKRMTSESGLERMYFKLTKLKKY